MPGGNHGEKIGYGGRRHRDAGHGNCEGAFLDQTQDFVLPKLAKGIYPSFIPGVSMGMIYTPDLARYAAIAATSMPDSALGTSVDVGWDEPASGQGLALAFSKVLGKTVIEKPAFPAFVTEFIMPVLGIFQPGMRDIYEMIKWIKTGAYVSKNTMKQKELFGDLPSIEEAARRYSKDRGLI